MIIDCHNHIGVELGGYLQGGFPYGQHLTDLVRQGRACGVTRFVVFPMVTHLAQDLAALREGNVAAGGLERVPYAFENRRLLREIHELFPDEGRFVWPFAMFDPAREAKAQVAALRALRREFPIYGLKTQTTMLHSPVRRLLDEGRVFLELAQEWNVPLLLHSSVLPSDEWAQASDILDIAEGTPQVRFCLAHSCRFDKPCLDRLARLPNCWFDPSAHGIHCLLATGNSPIVAPVERRFPSDYSRPEIVLRDLAQAYPDALMWGSDSPYYSFAAKVDGERLALLSSYELEAGYFHALPDEAKRRVGERNPLSWLGREVPRDERF